MNGSLVGQVAIVTGASRGLGARIAQDLARSGAAVALFARNRRGLVDLAAEIEAAGGKALAIAGDVTQRSDVESAVAQVARALGPVSLLVNNAGVDKPYGPVGIADPDEWWYQQAVHVRGALLFMSSVIPEMRRRRRGRILSVSSRAATVVGPGTSAYCVSKATLVRLIEHVHAENVDVGLAAFVIHPGTFFTDMAVSSIADPLAQQWAKPIVDFLASFKETDPVPALERLGRQVVALASGQYDALGGRYLDLEQELDDLLAASR
jgi:NAD(P)-dependent dehydrogenase (short-subunit alcohol dehydrogenase family)